LRYFISWRAGGHARRGVGIGSGILIAAGLLLLHLRQPAVAEDSIAVPPEWPSEVAQAIAQRRPLVHVWGLLTLGESRRLQPLVVADLVPVLGQPIGYKAALTSAAAQQRMGVEEPIVGVLLEKMLLPDGSTRSIAPGITTFVEADLLVRVDGTRLPPDATPRQALAALDAVIPFIELPDLIIDLDTPLSAPLLVAMNAGASAGVMGTAIPLADTDEWFARLAEFRVELADDTGTTMGTATGADLLGHPLQVVVKVQHALAEMGHALRPGSLISLGSLTAPCPVEAGRTYSARYAGLHPTGDVTIAVHMASPPDR